MKRKIYDNFLKWKNEDKGEVALIVEGARRIGKSYVVEEFARNEYDSYVIIDFSKVNREVYNLFEDYIDDLDSFFKRLELYFKRKLKPGRNAESIAYSLVVFDEVQFCPRARAAIKHLVADRRFDYIETGSLVSIKKNVKDILIPSEERAIQMHPMDFEEFLWACDEEMMWDFIKEQFSKKKPMGALHRKAMDLFRQYLIVGGMPQAVSRYVSSKDFDKVDKIKRDILNLYRNDIHKYADGQEEKVVSVFDEIPSQLRRHEKRFKVSDLGGDARNRDYSNAFFWLKDAKVINCCYKSTEPNIGLKLNEVRISLKCYMADTGLLISHAFDERGIVSEELYKKLMFDKLEVNKGMLVENIVAQMLVAAGHKLYFYSNCSREDSADRMEIDFLISKPSVTSRHNISPIEVKSGERYTLSSLRKCMAKYSSVLSTCYVLHDKDLKEENGVCYLPLYMTPLL